ncbi:MAG: GGDEF domain-containing protein [Nitrospirota bacterium]
MHISTVMLYINGSTAEWFFKFESDGKTFGFIHVVRDMTKRKQADEKLRHHTFYDQLTNLPNRELLSQYLEHMLGRLPSKDKYLFAVLFIDLWNLFLLLKKQD